MKRETLIKNIYSKSSFLCVGLDPDLEKIPKHLLDFDDPVFEFNKLIIDHTHDLCVAYKPNLAFYERLGSKGFESLRKTIEYIPSDQFVIADAKRSDIFNSAKMYADTFYRQFNFDAVTVSPYMGKDAVDPFLIQNKWAILLIATSNKNAFEIQNIILKSGEPLYMEVLNKASTWSNVDNMMFVIGANRLLEMKSIREKYPDHFFLVPGVGKQGGGLKEVCEQGLTMSCGLLVNMSRSILYADSGAHFYNYSRDVCLGVQQQMKQYLLDKKNLS
jgi:orotidine-5'-phosphate decarboxylase